MPRSLFGHQLVGYEGLDRKQGFVNRAVADDPASAPTRWPSENNGNHTENTFIKENVFGVKSGKNGGNRATKHFGWYDGKKR